MNFTVRTQNVSVEVGSVVRWVRTVLLSTPRGDGLPFVHSGPVLLTASGVINPEAWI